MIVLATPSPISHRTAEESLGISSLGSSLRESGHDVAIIDAWLLGLSSSELANRILSHEGLKLVGISSYMTNIEQAIQVVTAVKSKRPDMVFLAGGFGPTFHPEEFLRGGFDYVVIGEGELAIVKIAEQLETGGIKPASIPNLSYLDAAGHIHKNETKFTTDLDSLPFPIRDTTRLSIRRKSAVHIESSRGCGAACIFSSIATFQRTTSAPRWRQKSLSRFVDELEILHQRGVRLVKVIDDSFIEPPRGVEWCEQLATEINRRNIKLAMRGSIRADRVNDEILAALKEAGFFSFSCGIENYSSTALKRMGKPANLNDNLLALSLFKKHEIYVQAGHILFDHGTTLFELEENLVHMKNTSWTISKGIFTEMFAAQGTPFTNLVKKRQLAISSPSPSLNIGYTIKDPYANLVRNGLKNYHKSISPLYDKCVDVLAAPKLVSKSERVSFHDLSCRLRKLDLEIFGELISSVKGGANESDIDSFVRLFLKTYSAEFEAINLDLCTLYNNCDLEYDGDINPFLSDVLTLKID